MVLEINVYYTEVYNAMLATRWRGSRRAYQDSFDIISIKRLP
jgi:hypothetical protein